MISYIKKAQRLSSSQLLNKVVYSLVILNEYKFYVDFKGIMYFDDGKPISPTNIIKDKKFLNKFYKSLNKNTTKDNPDCPYMGDFWG